MKKIFTLAAIAAISVSVAKADYTTANDGKEYSLKTLSEIAETGVTTAETGVYEITGVITISENDTFSIGECKTVKMGDGAQIRIEGQADLAATANSPVEFTRTDENAVPKGIFIGNETDIVVAKDLTFNYCGLQYFGSAGIKVDNCHFNLNNGAQSSIAALTVGKTGAITTIKKCTFTDNTVPAIGGAANAAAGVTIEDCVLSNNNSANTNKPQINIAVGGDNDVVIRNTVIKGAKLNMVGGIAVANLVGIEGANNIFIEGCDIRDCRYGITTMAACNLVLKNNILIDNKYESNAMNGGSAVSVYDPYMTQSVYAEGNTFQGSLWGITVIGCGNVNLGRTDVPETDENYNPGNNIFKDNGNGGALYDLYNNSTTTVYAQGNTWNVDEQTAEKIETVIFHKNDDPKLGEVIYMDKTGGVDDIIFNQESNAIYFNLQGIQVESPENGVFIRKRGNKTDKITIK